MFVANGDAPRHSESPSEIDMNWIHAAAIIAALSSHALAAEPSSTANFLLERVTTCVPFPRGLQIIDGQLHVLCRGRVREYGGVSADVEDQAGSLYVVDSGIAEPYSSVEPSDAVRTNGRLLAAPTAPPFKLWDRTASPPVKDRETDRPYCGLTWHDPTRSLYICAFSGVDKPEGKGSTFSKNLSDAILRYDLRTSKWYEVERHDIEKGGLYPHHDPSVAPAPHGWLNGPDNCLAVGDWLYAVSKDNSRLVRYDLRALVADPEAGPPPSEVVFGEELAVAGHGTLRLQGHSALGRDGNWLYVATRTSSHIVRLALDSNLAPIQPLRAELVALFDPYDPKTRKSSNLTDMSIGPNGDVYVVSATPARIFRITPDPKRAFDAREGKATPYVDLAALTGNPKMKSENLLVDAQGRIYMTSGDAYAYQHGAGGVVWRVTPQ